MTTPTQAERERLMELICEFVSPGELRVTELRDAILAASFRLAPAAEDERAVAHELERDLRRQNWKLGGSLVMDSDEAREKIAAALAQAKAEARREARAYAVRFLERWCRENGWPENIAAALAGEPQP